MYLIIKTAKIFKVLRFAVFLAAFRSFFGSLQWGKVTGISNGEGVKGTVSLPLSAKILNVSIGILSANDNDPFILISATRDGEFDYIKGNAYSSGSDGVEFFWQALTYV